MGLEVVDRKLQHHSQLLQCKLAAAEFRGVERRLIVVAEQMFVVSAAGGCRAQQMLGQNHSCSQARTIGTVAAFSDAIEPVAGSDDPRVRGWALQVLAEVLENRRVFRGKGSKVVNRFVYAGCQAGGGHVVAQDSPIHHLREEG